MSKVENLNRVRHPEKANKPENVSLRKPAWIRVKAPTSEGYHETRKLMRARSLVTVCEEAACPNIGECWSKKHATVMILGDICTRACAFCNVATGKPGAVDLMEPENLAISVAELGMKHLVITSVDRDDLEDGGADQFVKCIQRIRETTPETTIEILTPDFREKPGALEKVIAAKPDVFNHNLETVPRLYPSIRPGARYFHSLKLLDTVKREDPSIFTKSGIMVGLGETRIEVMQVMDDLRSADVDFLTIAVIDHQDPRLATRRADHEPWASQLGEALALGVALADAWRHEELGVTAIVTQNRRTRHIEPVLARYRIRGCRRCRDRDPSDRLSVEVDDTHAQWHASWQNQQHRVGVIGHRQQVIRRAELAELRVNRFDMLYLIHAPHCGREASQRVRRAAVLAVEPKALAPVNGQCHGCAWGAAFMAYDER